MRFTIGGYPCSVASFHVFRTKDLVHLNTTTFKGPNSFEGIFCSVLPQNRNYMSCYETAKSITSTNSKIQTENANRFCNLNSLNDLNSQFISGKRLCPDINDKLVCNMAHGPVQLIFK